MARSDVGSGSRIAVSGPVVAVVWLGLAIMVGLQQLVLRSLAPTQAPLWTDLKGKLVLLPLWALATPFVLRAGARHPLGGVGGWRALGRHLAQAGAFIVASNLLIRLPHYVWPGRLDLAGLGASLLEGLTRYGGFALVAWFGIVSLGQWLGARAGSADTRPDSLELRDGARRVLIPFDRIALLKADDNHVIVHEREGTHRVRERLSELEKALDSERFVRVHRSAVVALDRVAEVVPTEHGDWSVRLSNGVSVRVARGRRAALQEALATRVARSDQGDGRSSASR